METSRVRSFTPHPDRPSNKALLDPLSLMDEEDQSVSKQLNLIHKEYDKIKTVNKKKQSLIIKLKKDIESAQKSSSVLNDDKYTLDSRIQRLENYLETVIIKRKEEEKYMKSYQYLLDRIKEDRFSLDKELKMRQADLSQKRSALTLERQKTKKVQEKTLKDKLEILNLSENIDKEKRLQEDTLALIEKKATERSKAVLVLEENNKNREMIADAAQSQISNSETLEFRHKLLVNRFWFHFLNRKLKSEFEKGGAIEEPFQKIKITTGMQTVEEILTRYLTREEAYKDLVAAVKTSERNINDLKLKIKEATSRFQGLRVEEGEEGVQVEVDLIRTEKRSFINYKEMSDKYELLLQNIQEWAKKQLTSMKINPDEQDIKGLILRIKLENEKLMKEVELKARGNEKLLDDVLYLSTSKFISKNSFTRHFEDNCRVSPEKKSIVDEDTPLLQGN